MTMNDSIDFFFRQFAQEFVRNRARDIRDKGLLNSEDLLRSLYAKVNSDPANGRFLMLVFVKTYGRYQDMRRQYTKAGGEEMIKMLEEWVGKEGVDKFKKGKYAERLSNKTPQQVKNAVAWGIARKLTRSTGTRKRSWWNKGKTKDIENFYDVLVRIIRESVAEEIKTAI
jgi:hypothetical protein